MELRSIADKIDRSASPDRRLVVAAIRSVLRKVAAGDQYVGKLTTYDGMADGSGLGGLDGSELWGHLDGSPDNAILLQMGSQVYAVWNVPDMSGYFYQALPLEDPNDADQVGRDPGELMNAIA